MKKGKMILGALALFVALGAAYAFKANTLPGNLYYFNSDGSCVKAPCETTNITNNQCQNSPLYSNEGCSTEYGGNAWTTDGGN
jgi:hypothetical protein